MTAGGGEGGERRVGVKVEDEVDDSWWGWGWREKGRYEGGRRGG